MTTQAINEAIAKICGWKLNRRNIWEFQGMSEDDGLRLPNYSGSLDAMAEAEKMLTDEKQTDYVDWFFHNLPEEEDHGEDPDSGNRIMAVGIWQILHATAAQRAQAFLEVMKP